MTPRTLELLRLLQHSSRTMKSLTHGDYSAHPAAISGWMDRLMDAGYAESATTGSATERAIAQTVSRMIGNPPAGMALPQAQSTVLCAGCEYITNETQRCDPCPHRKTPAGVMVDAVADMHAAGAHPAPLTRISNEQREAIVRQAVESRDALLTGKGETVLLIKRSASGDFAGDKTWQVAPYPIRDHAHALKIVDWMRTCGISFDFRISTLAEMKDAA